MTTAIATDYTTRPDAPEGNPFGMFDRFPILIVEDVTTDLGNVLVPAGTVTWAWVSYGAGDRKLGIPADAVTAWTPEHYAGVQWSSLRPETWQHL